MRNITLRHLRTLLAVQRFGKISRAAQHMGLTSPAVTLQLQQVEAELGAQLFERRKQGVTVTEAGEMVLETAGRIVSELQALEASLSSYKGLESGRVRLGVVSTGKYFAPRILAAFAKLHPNLEVSLHASNREEIIRRLKDHQIDLALMGRPPKGMDVKAVLVGDHPHVFIAPPDHPIANRIDIERSELVREKFIIREQGSGTRSLFEFFMSDISGGLLHPPSEMDSNETIKQAVAAGLGIAFISGHTIEQELNNGSLVILDVSDTPIRRHWFLIRNLKHSATPAVEALETFLATKGMSLLPILPKTYRE